VAQSFIGRIAGARAISGGGLERKMVTRFCSYCEEMLDEIEIIVVDDEKKLVCGRCKEAYEMEMDRRVNIEGKELG